MANLNFIKPIDKGTVNQICSGQVVLTLATAVKELLENSIDAGSTSVQLRLKEFGGESIEVIDNGSGVEESNFQGLTLKHHTSKLTNFSDLTSIETFGFRGEALSSLCALANVSIVTRHESVQIGTRLRFDHNGHIVENTSTARQVGTTVTVDNLFVTLPVRYKEFQRNLRREFGKMCTVLHAYALLNEKCSIICSNKVAGKNKIVLETRASSIRNNIGSIFGAKQLQDLLQITTQEPDDDLLNEFRCKRVEGSRIKLDGYISSCAHGSGRSSSDRQFFYINSRPVDSSKISRLVNDIYHQYNAHQSPFVVLNICTDSESVDVNVVPDKRLILMEHENLILATIKSSLMSIFCSLPATVSLQTIRSTSAETQSNESMNSSQSSLFERFALLKGNTQKPVAGKDVRTENIKQPCMTKFLNKRHSIQISNTGPEPDEESTQTKRLKLADDDSNNESVENWMKKPLFDYKDKQINDQQCPVTLEDDSINLDRDSPASSDSVNQSHNNQATNKLTYRLPYVVHIEDCPVSGDSFDLDSDSPSNSESVEQSLCSQEVENMKIAKPKDETLIDESMEEASSGVLCDFDEGLSESERSNRRSTVVNVSLGDISNLRRRTLSNVEKLSVKFHAKIEPGANDRAETELRRELSKTSFMDMKILGQFNKGFIITRLAQDLFIIDQHANDEKYNFEKLSKDRIRSQPLTVPQQLRLTADKEELMISCGEIIRANGFDFVVDSEADATQRIRLTAVPVAKGVTLGSRDVDELLFLLEDAPTGQMCRPSRVRDIMASRACRMSVMIGTSLNHSQMKRLVSHMAEMDQPWNCPHGRPTIRHLISLDLIQ